MRTFYGPSISSDEIWHWKYTRRYRKGGKWVYEYPDDVVENTQTYQDPQGNTYVRKDVNVAYNGLGDGKNPAQTSTKVTTNADGSKTTEYTTVRERGKVWAMANALNKTVHEIQHKKISDFHHERAYANDFIDKSITRRVQRWFRHYVWGDKDWK